MPTLYEYLAAKLNAAPTTDAIEELEREEIRSIQKAYFADLIKSCESALGRTVVAMKGDLVGRQVWLDPTGILRLVPRHRQIRTSSGTPECAYVALLQDASDVSLPKGSSTPAVAQPNGSAGSSSPKDSSDPEKAGSAEVAAQDPLHFRIVLDRRHSFTKMIVADAHKAVCHQGRSYTKAEVGRRFYVPRMSYLIGKLCYNCSFCRERQPTPVKPITADLHSSRLNMGKPAWYEVGMDHFGPYQLKSNVKRWGLIFIDLTSRAVHIEHVPSPNMEHVVLAAERMFNRRARPQILRCDLGTGFQKFAKELNKTEEEYKHILCGHMLKKYRIRMHFNPANAPHWGGSWERMIKEVKKILGCCMENQKCFSDVEFYTFLTRAEAILNRRPLAFTEDGDILTPNSLINQAADRMMPMIGENIIASVKRVRDAILEFWTKWHNFYLSAISATKRMGHISQHDLQPGDWVLRPRHPQPAHRHLD